MLGETYDLKQNLEWVPDLIEERKIPPHLGEFWQSNLCFYSIMGNSFSRQRETFLSDVWKALKTDQSAATPSCSIQGNWDSQSFWYLMGLSDSTFRFQGFSPIFLS